ncbi:hypothetical protein D9M73_81760 [compost metagenome]
MTCLRSLTATTFIQAASVFSGPNLKRGQLLYFRTMILLIKFVSRMCHVFRSSGLLVLGFIVSLRRVAGGGLGEETERNDICG